jgi:superfamily I DNA and/or RNA helicase
MIGDHKQLPPVVISPEAKNGGLSRSLFERLIQPKSANSEDRFAIDFVL